MYVPVCLYLKERLVLSSSLIPICYIKSVLPVITQTGSLVCSHQMVSRTNEVVTTDVSVRVREQFTLQLSGH